MDEHGLTCRADDRGAPAIPRAPRLRVGPRRRLAVATARRSIGACRPGRASAQGAAPC